MLLVLLTLLVRLLVIITDNKIRSYLNCYVNLLLKIKWWIYCWVDFNECWISSVKNILKLKYAFKERIRVSCFLYYVIAQIFDWLWIALYLSHVYIFLFRYKECYFYSFGLVQTWFLISPPQTIFQSKPILFQEKDLLS